MTTPIRTCSRCGSLISLDECWYPYDNDDPYCSDCCSDIENSPIHDYLSLIHI